jgi:hypothetical protein
MNRQLCSNYQAVEKTTGMQNSLVQHFHSQGTVGDFEGLTMITWDTKENAYKEHIFGSDFPGCVVQIGQFEDTLGLSRRIFHGRNEDGHAQHYEIGRSQQDRQRGIYFGERRSGIFDDDCRGHKKKPSAT